MAVYINGMANISPQSTWDSPRMLKEIVAVSGERLSCIEPDYSQYIDAKSIRRMSRAIKMGVASAFIALQDADVKMPDGIITATGLGCLEDSGIFLSKLIENKEQAVNPTPFIQSTHNTIGSQVALMLQCLGYNQTYTHVSFSFETALTDAMMMITDNPSFNLLTGAVDEITDISHRIYKRFGIFADSKGVMHGEGAAFFVLSGERHTRSIAEIVGVEMFYKPDQKTLVDGIGAFLSSHALDNEKVDLILFGLSGNNQADEQLDHLRNTLFATNLSMGFKHLCGEYPVASSFATWLGATIVSNGPGLLINANKPIQTVLIVNQYFSTHYSLILLRK